MAERVRPVEMPDWPRGMREDLAAAYVGLSVNGLRAKVEAGEIAPPKHHSPGRIVYLKDNLDAYLDRLSKRKNSWGAQADPVNEWDAACGIGHSGLPGDVPFAR